MNKKKEPKLTRSISIDDDTWIKAKEIAEYHDLPVSSLIRKQIKENWNEMNKTKLN